MLEPLSAIALAGNVLQFLDFGIKATSKAREIHNAASGALKENDELGYLSEHIADTVEKFRLGSGNKSLDDICERCRNSAMELLEALDGLKTCGRANKSKIQSVRKALKTIWGKQKLEDMRSNLLGLRDEIQFFIVTDLKTSLDSKSTTDQERFDQLDESVKLTLTSMASQFSTLQDTIGQVATTSSDRALESLQTIEATQENLQTVILESISNQTNGIKAACEATTEEVQNSIEGFAKASAIGQEASTNTIISHQEQLNGEVVGIVEQIDANSRLEHEATRRELEQLKTAMAQIVKDIANRDEELKQLLAELSHSRDPGKQKRLRERSNAVTVALCALVTVYESLQSLLLSLNAHAKKILTTSVLYLPLVDASFKFKFAAGRKMPGNVLAQLEFPCSLSPEEILLVIGIDSREDAWTHIPLTIMDIPMSSTFSDIVYQKIGQDVVLDHKNSTKKGSWKGREKMFYFFFLSLGPIFPASFFQMT